MGIWFSHVNPMGGFSKLKKAVAPLIFMQFGRLKHQISLKFPKKSDSVVRLTLLCLVVLLPFWRENDFPLYLVNYKSSLLTLSSKKLYFGSRNMYIESQDPVWYLRYARWIFVKQLKTTKFLNWPYLENDWKSPMGNFRPSQRQYYIASFCQIWSLYL